MVRRQSAQAGASKGIGNVAFADFIIIVALALAPGYNAAAEPVDDQPDIEEIVVAETRLAGDVFGVGESVAVDADGLSRTQPVDAEQLFQGLPGFSVSRPGGPGGVSEIFLRGAESNFTSVYVDGIRLNDSSNTRGGSFDFSTLGIYDVDSIDIASGAMSAVYGADAMAGVVRIRSAWPRWCWIRASCR